MEAIIIRQSNNVPLIDGLTGNKSGYSMMIQQVIRVGILFVSYFSSSLRGSEMYNQLKISTRITC